MRTTIRCTTFGWTVLASVLAFIATSGHLSAQRWQSEFGSALCAGEHGMAGARPVSTGGYIAAGTSHSALPSCSQADVYVVKTDDDGVLEWAYTYHMGNDGLSHGLSIIECSNGDFMVSGIMGSINNCCCNPMDVFLMRLKPDGTLIWMKSYGTASTDYGMSVIEMATGNGTYTNPGDFVVSGVTFRTSDSTHRGYLLRVTASGRLIWARSYAFESNPLTHQVYPYTDFSDIDEDVYNQTGTIVIVGTVRNLSTGVAKGLLFRVNGNTGMGAADPRVWTANSTSTTARAVKVLSGTATGTNVGDIAVTGSIEWGTSLSAYAVRFAANGCALSDLAKKYYLDDLWSEARDIQETSTGTLLIGGSADAGVGNLSDVMLIEAAANNLNYAGSGLHLYGGNGDDRGEAAHEVQAGGGRTAGFYLTGKKASNKLYMIKADALGNSLCNYSSPMDTPVQPTISITCPGFNVDSVAEWCTPPIVADYRSWENQLCYSSTKTQQADDPSGSPSAVQPTDLSLNSVIPISDDASVTGYPNPVRKGSIFNLEYSLAHPGRISIDVVDVAGKTVYTRSGDYPAGTSQIPVNTDGWSSGTYILTLTRDGATAAQRITVLDK